MKHVCVCESFTGPWTSKCVGSVKSDYHAFAQWTSVVHVQSGTAVVRAAISLIVFHCS